jgi:glycosyltransferase involved in cell wall biosynthesis
MEIVHFTWWAPRKSGMYESVKDQIKYERKQGAISHFIDPKKENPAPDLIDDNWLSPAPWSVAEKADIWVMHGQIPEKIKHLFDQKVTVAVLHGPTEHMVLKEWTSNRSESAFNLHINMIWRYDASVVINQHEYDVMKLYDEKDRLHYIPNSIDLERYTPEGIKWEYDHHPAIGSFDVSRLEKLPTNLIWSMPKVVEKIPNARLNLFSLPLEPVGMYRNIFCRNKERSLESKCMEMIQFGSPNLRPFMRGIDVGFNNNISGIASRVTMEMMAMGVPVVSYGGDYTNYVARIWDFDSIAEQIIRCWKDLSKSNSTLKGDTLKYAKKNFDRDSEVKKYMKLYDDLLKAKKDKK